MDWRKEYRSFISSHYLSDGIRTTFAVLTPVLLLSFYGMMPTGLVIGMGALTLSITDAPGPAHHRRNGLMIGSLLIFCIALLTGFVQSMHWAFMLVLPVCCFVFSMIGVYGARATSIGLASLVVLVLQTQRHLAGMDIVYNALLMLAGCAWYLLLSVALYSIRPYKIIQQALGEYVMATADYLKGKAAFYETGFSYENDYEEIVKLQVIVEQKQALVAELLFKTRSVVKESTHTGRVLMMVFLDVADLFELVMTSHQDYEKLHRYFDETGILADYRQLIQALAGELDTIGIALKSGRSSSHDAKLDEELTRERRHLQALRSEKISPDNLEGFISLRHILDSIDELATRVRVLHAYTSYDKKFRRRKINLPDPDAFITHQPIDPQLVIDNLSFRSNIFRHSLRIAAAALFAYIVSQFLPWGHGYWILLTTIVILKPGYSLTRTRNIERLAGTIIGAGIGALLLYLVRDRAAIVVLLTISMIGAYSFMRKHYFTSVILITLYVLLMFHLLEPQDFRSIFTDRIIDTLIGSGIAFLFGNVFSPVWENEQANTYMQKVLTDLILYYQSIAGVFAGDAFDRRTAILMRKNSWVSLANLSDAFDKMLSEPKSKQKNIQLVHQFVVAIHMLNAHIATLAYYVDSLQSEYIHTDYVPVMNASIQALQRSKKILETDLAENPKQPVDAAQVRSLDQRINELVRKRQEELREGKLETSDTGKLLSTAKSIADQFYFIYKIAVDVEKVCGKMRG